MPKLQFEYFAVWTSQLVDKSIVLYFFSVFFLLCFIDDLHYLLVEGGTENLSNKGNTIICVNTQTALFSIGPSNEMQNIQPKGK